MAVLYINHFQDITSTTAPANYFPVDFSSQARFVSGGGRTPGTYGYHNAQEGIFYFGRIGERLAEPRGAVGQPGLIASCAFRALNTTLQAVQLRHIIMIQDGIPFEVSTEAAFTNATANYVSIGFTTTGFTQIRVNNVQVALGTIPVDLTSWHRLEVELNNINDDFGSVKVYVSGVLHLEYVGKVQPSGAPGFTWVTYGAVFNGRTCDLLVMDTSGSTMNAPIGDVLFETLAATGVGSTTQSTPTGAATSWQAVTKAAPNNDTSYASIGTIGHKDTYLTADTTAVEPNEIVAVVGVLRLASRGLTMRSVGAVTRLAGNEADSVSQPVYTNMTANTYRANHYELIKPGGGPWTVPEFNAAEFGWKVTG